MLIKFHATLPESKSVHSVAISASIAPLTQWPMHSPGYLLVVLLQIFTKSQSSPSTFMKVTILPYHYLFNIVCVEQNHDSRLFSRATTIVPCGAFFHPWTSQQWLFGDLPACQPQPQLRPSFADGEGRFWSLLSHWEPKNVMQPRVLHFEGLDDLGWNPLGRALALRPR